MKVPRILCLIAATGLCAHATDVGFGVAIRSGQFDYDIHCPIRHDNGMRSIVGLSFTKEKTYLHETNVSASVVQYEEENVRSYGLDYSLLWELASREGLSTQLGFGCGLRWQHSDQTQRREDRERSSSLRRDGWYAGPRLDFEYAFNRSVSFNWGLSAVYSSQDETRAQGDRRRDGKLKSFGLESALSMRVYF